MPQRDRMDWGSELNRLQFEPYPEIFERFKALSSQYGDMPIGNIISAFTRATEGKWTVKNPYIQNQRIKEIQSLPKDYTKDKLVEMLRNPGSNERPLREIAHALEYTAYPLQHLRHVYQEMLTYHNYTFPRFSEDVDAAQKNFWREWRLIEKLRTMLNPKEYAHQITGQALVEGKVFYYPRISIDKAHNKINYAFMQQLPSNWTKIVGFNNISGYTIAFNMFYFLQPGTTPDQFGDLFTPYIDQFDEVLNKPPKGIGTKIVYAEKQSCGINMERYKKLLETGKARGNPDTYYQNGKWFYWVTLPVDSVYTFEIDDVMRNVVSPFTGLFLAMLQIAQYEQLQLMLLTNPLLAVMTGEIPYRDNSDATKEDAYKLSNAGRQLFEAYWYNMLASNNTSGIGLYMAPLENITMHTLSEAPSATEVSSKGYSYAIDKSGLSGIIPTSGDTRAGTANISFKIESGFAKRIYSCMERMMNQIIQGLNLNYEWGFRMFGSLATDAELEESTRKGMTLGILPDMLVYNAIHDRSILDDIAISRAVSESGIMDLRLPLVSTYSAKQSEGNLPPQHTRDGLSPEEKHMLEPGGRATSGAEVNTEGHENDLDSYAEE